eukprot:CAMPEP_0184337952 /NCGR_PEP_ID=MMETSP1089-20130417/6448_1 /TAXON_ID=38269 ORGANISM="Gloeochaete wittrockiana, Strain SAG46.84" /NCGR_SAMPLE_ID=MMETSP1089 /ASSEMBLY_ACC=CAM_ASM_000445 /LENGTH=256 /DNA_ID=CAMNT_0026664121 /DNA_START=67 /DNA_END=837 /DNA_ORIENTATION=-
MKLLEYRIPLPLTCEEYRIGQLFSVAKASKQETTGDTGVEVLLNEPFEKDGRSGQYTHKIYHLGSRLPGWIAAILPANMLKLEEKAWNAFPYCRTELSNPSMGDRFTYTIESKHFDDDRGEQENVLEIEAKQLKNRTVTVLDIADPVNECLEDPASFTSVKSGRGPFPKGWFAAANPVMCAYKLVTIEFRYWGLQGKVENFVTGIQGGILAKFHKQVVCWMDEWHGMSMEDVRAYETRLAEEMKQSIEEKAKEGKK